MLKYWCPEFSNELVKNAFLLWPTFGVLNTPEQLRAHLAINFNKT